MKRLQLVENIFLRVLFGGKSIASERLHARSAINTIQSFQDAHSVYAFTTLRLSASMVLIALVSASHASGMAFSDLSTSKALSRKAINVGCVLSSW